MRSAHTGPNGKRLSAQASAMVGGSGCPRLLSVVSDRMVRKGDICIPPAGVIGREVDELSIGPKKALLLTVQDGDWNKSMHDVQGSAWAIEMVFGVVRNGPQYIWNMARGVRCQLARDTRRSREGEEMRKQRKGENSGEDGEDTSG